MHILSIIGKIVVMDNQGEQFVSKPINPDVKSSVARLDYIPGAPPHRKRQDRFCQQLELRQLHM